MGASKTMEELGKAEEVSKIAHEYLDALLARNEEQAMIKYKAIYGNKGVGGGGAFNVVFCLDESGSMKGQPWCDLCAAFTKFLEQRRGRSDVVSVVQFSSSARTTLSCVTVEQALSATLDFQSGGTQFHPALLKARFFLENPSKGMTPVLIFMSDGENGDGDCDSVMQQLADASRGLVVHTIFFGCSHSERLQSMAAVVNGQYHGSVDGVKLQETFEDIARGLEFAGWT